MLPWLVVLQKQEKINFITRIRYRTYLSNFMKMDGATSLSFKTVDPHLFRMQHPDPYLYIRIRIRIRITDPDKDNWPETLQYSKFSIRCGSKKVITTIFLYSFGFTGSHF